jgi:hypothetical protein
MPAPSSPALTPAPAAQKQECEAAVCLLMILEHGPRPTGTTAESFGANGTNEYDLSFPGPKYAAATTTVRGLVDAWGVPYLYTRIAGGTQPAGNVWPPEAGTVAIVSAGSDRRFGINFRYFTTAGVPSTELIYGNDNIKSTSAP